MTPEKVIKRDLIVGGRELSVEIGRVAGQASGAALARYGDTVVLSTATHAQLREGLDFFPLTVDFEERHYAVGRIPGSFLKREGRPGEKAILSARIIDRSIRPLFPKQFRRDVHIVNTVLSVEQDCAPIVAALFGTSCALAVSDIPFNGPVGGVIVGRVDGRLVINPTLEQSVHSDMHLTLAGHRDAVNMVECGAYEVPEEVILEAIAFGHEEIKRIVAFIEDLRAECLAAGLAKEKLVVETVEPDPELVAAIKPGAADRIKETVFYCRDNRLEKKPREELLEKVKEELRTQALEAFPEQEAVIREIVDSAEKEVFRTLIARDKVRIDGRATDEIRPIKVEAGVLPRTHGSGLFQRGQTQVLSVVTLGAVSDEQILDNLSPEESKRFMHHYNFPSYSTGETRPIRSPGRREIGHGALAERALEAVIPPEDTFPYTLRIVSEVLSSNGSTSMGSVCGSTLALMDAGVPIKAPVAGIAMGLIMEGEDFTILTDIQGIEDHLGDMDFKVAGTTKGITALQMDIKISGVKQGILSRALAQGRQARLYILDRIRELLPAPRPELSPLAPRVLHTVIDPDKIREVIGPGGKVIRKITEETGADIDIEDDGRCFITAPDGESAKKALSIIEAITAEVEVGKIYLGRVTKCTDFGCFVEVIPGVLGLPGKEGLVHISQLAPVRIRAVEDVVKEGDQILVKAIGYDQQGRLKLSKKEAMTPEERAAAGEQPGAGGAPAPRREREHRPRMRGGRDR
ncbi:MAG: polyribonucleotide nucleotidyltransferase [Bacillota bacterium]|nr:polyribonucleotide nucleotidyltransferase [Bacillota bacterium]